MSHELERASYDAMTNPALEREQEWLRSTVGKNGKKKEEPHWMGSAENSNPQTQKVVNVRSIARATSNCISPLRDVGPGTNRAFWGRRVYHYSGESSEGNRYITDSQL